MKERSYAIKSVVQMVLVEGYNDIQEIADELGVSRKYINNIIRKLEPTIQKKVREKLYEKNDD